jgi:uncharacterized protein YbjQ (UPF0145 family)
MKIFRTIGSLAFVAGLFTLVFVGATYMIWHEPLIPWWLKVAIYFMFGGILVVMISLVTEKSAGGAKEAALPADMKSRLPILNTETVPGREITEVLGLVQGHTIYAIWLGNDLSAIVRLLIGGELTEYTEMMGKARTLAVERMVGEAEQLGADAVVNVRLMTASVVGSAAELLAYGTAVRMR